ncbi:hypothetical protein [Siccibacter colletis]|jgi:membrane protein implicated in regulation of membrane protease activity|uniref:hypothetical protein n=1 Tax=Siccibacter colletis TaxID=1505757 RepID=UPI00068D7008|nr:hypothetical protein [Siccibacter colletis]
MKDIFIKTRRWITLQFFESLAMSCFRAEAWCGGLLVAGALLHHDLRYFYLLEVIVFIILTFLLLWLMRKTDRDSRQVGTVRIGSPMEREADRVLFLFDLTERVNALLMALLFPAFCLSFAMIDYRWALWCHHLWVLILAVTYFRLSRRLNRMRKERGYGEYTRHA